MNLQDVLEFVTVNAGTESAPVLTDSEVLQCVERASVVDAQGRAPIDPDWTPTYNEYYATAQALRLRSRKARLGDAGQSTVTSWTADNASFTKQVRDTSADLAALADEWDDEAFGSPALTGIPIRICGTGGVPRSGVDLDSNDEFLR